MFSLFIKLKTDGKFFPFFLKNKNLSSKDQQNNSQGKSKNIKELPFAILLFLSFIQYEIHSASFHHFSHFCQFFHLIILQSCSPHSTQNVLSIITAIQQLFSLHYSTFGSFSEKKTMTRIPNIIKPTSVSL
jgi:hypothetical protein